jgi:Tfp pilus assembly protein PilO
MYRYYIVILLMIAVALFGYWMGYLTGKADGRAERREEE